MNMDKTHPPRGGDAHGEAQELLPWLASGRLAGTELERVQAHLQGCAACRADLAALHTLRAAGQDALPGLDPERALARLLPQLDAPSGATPTAMPAPDAQPIQPVPPLEPIRGWRGRLAANDARWLRVAAALQCCVIAVLAVLLARPFDRPGADEGAYRVLGADAAEQGRLIVVFKPDTPERELRRIVGAGGAHVIGGPTATGAWLLATDGAPLAAAQRLRAEPAVTLAEPLAAEGRP